jgi:glycerophosphoryl diester phosphodiesterase
VKPTPFMVIAHRGASASAPENTLAAFDLALQMGVHHVELDVTTTSDGHVVVIHDDTLDRTTNGSGPVSSHTLATLRTLEAGSWFGAQFAGQCISTFEEILERYKGRLHIHTEIKGRTLYLARDTAELIRKHGMQDQVTITSFQKVRLEEIRTHAPDLSTGWLVREMSDEIIAQARAMGMRQLCPRADMVTPALVQRLHAEDLIVRAHGIKNDELMRQVVQAGADGMTVNWPDRLIAHLESIGRAWE